jgi:hypothetical protein
MKKKNDAVINVFNLTYRQIEKHLELYGTEDVISGDVIPILHNGMWVVALKQDCNMDIAIALSTNLNTCLNDNRIPVIACVGDVTGFDGKVLILTQKDGVYFDKFVFFRSPTRLRLMLHTIHREYRYDTSPVSVDGEQVPKDY